ncbi:MAG: CopG family transcriptional regulator [Acetobacteraceae bacterium]
MSATHPHTDSLPAETPEQREARLVWEARAIEEAKAQADAGLLIPAAKVRAWVESWGTPNELPQPTPKKN